MRLNLSDAVDDLAPPPPPCFFNRGSWIAYLKSAAAAQNHKGSHLSSYELIVLHWHQAERPGARNTTSEAVAAPTDKRGFVTPKFWGWCARTRPALFWARCATPRGRRHGFGRVTNISPT